MAISFTEACERLSISDIDLIKWIDIFEGRGIMITEVRDRLKEDRYGRVKEYKYLGISIDDLKKLFYGSNDRVGRFVILDDDEQVIVCYYLNHFETLEIEIELFEKIKAGLAAVRRSRTIENLQIAENKWRFQV